MNRILDKCPLCYHDDTNKPPVAPVVSLATRVYLTLPTVPEIGDGAGGESGAGVGGACIVPLQHRVNLLECDDDEWEEIRVSLSFISLFMFLVPLHLSHSPSPSLPFFVVLSPPFFSSFLLLSSANEQA